MDDRDLMILDLTWYWQMDGATNTHIKPIPHGALHCRCLICDLIVLLSQFI